MSSLYAAGAVRQRCGMRNVIGVLFASLLCSCSPLSPFVPPALPPSAAPLVLSSHADWPGEDVQVFVDDLGIPHIFARSRADAAYALGVMHGRERSFQIFLYVHAAEGRLTEILGKDLLDVDRENRLLTYGLDEQLKEANAADAELLAAYCSGLNRGAAMAGRTAEMTLIGARWQPVTPRDVLAVARFQQWDQGIGFREELARYHLVKALGRDNPVVEALLIDTPSGGVPVVAASEIPAPPSASSSPPSSTSPPPRASQLASTSLSAPAGPAPSTGATAIVPPQAGAPFRAALTGELQELFGSGGRGASNSWAVAPEHTAKGVAVLANDPHLAHMTPGVFYLADLHVGGDYVVAGGTFPGIPAVLIGHGRHIAWGVTNAYADTQDLVLLKRDGDGYLVDGVHHAFGAWPQSFGDVHEHWHTTVFGPVLPRGYGGVDVGDDALALLWTAQQYPVDNGRLVTAFWNLAGAANVDEATRALQDFSSPAMSVNMAFTDGTIAYRLSGIVPVRKDAERVDYPRATGWSGRVSAQDKPQLTNPAKGYIIASNQRVLEDGVGAQAAVGFEGAGPYRAMRIEKRLHALIDGGKKASTDDILAIQQDVTAIDAAALAPVLARHCPKHVDGHDDAQLKAFCDAVGGFDGVFTTDAVALPFARTQHAFVDDVLRAHVDEALAGELSHQSFVQWALKELVLAEDKGARSPVFDDPKTTAREGLDGFVAKAVKQALDLVVEEAGDDWTWGHLHRLDLRGVLAGVPLVGGLFSLPGMAESGYDSTPRAEHPDFGHRMRVRAGAGLRLIAEMTDPPTVRMVNDTGESGHFGSPHIGDQYPLWHDGKPRVISMDLAGAERAAQGAMTIRPRQR